MLVGILTVAIAFVLIDGVRWMSRPAARRLRVLRKLEASSNAARDRGPEGAKRQDWWWIP